MIVKYRGVLIIAVSALIELCFPFDVAASTLLKSPNFEKEVERYLADDINVSKKLGFYNGFCPSTGMFAYSLKKMLDVSAELHEKKIDESYLRRVDGWVYVMIGDLWRHMGEGESAVPVLACQIAEPAILMEEHLAKYYSHGFMDMGSDIEKRFEKALKESIHLHELYDCGGSNKHGS